MKVGRNGRKAVGINQKTKTMKAIISELWETGREIVVSDSDEDRPLTFSDIKKCDNVVFGESIPGTRMREALIDERIVILSATKVHHPIGGTMYVIEVE